MRATTRALRRRRTCRSGVAIALAAALAAGLSACGGGSSTTTTGGGGGASTAGGAVTAGGTQEAGAAAVDDQLALDYVKGTAGAADESKKPITIGWINAQGGTQSLPEATAAAKAAVAYVNAELGGIDGHPLRLKTCFVVANEEQGQACAQQLANDPDVDFVDFGGVFIGNASIHNVLGGRKPVLGSIASVPPDFGAKDAYFFYGDQANALGGLATFVAENQKAKNVSILYPQQAGSDSAAKLVQEALEAQGVKVKAVGYPPTVTDVVGPLTASGAQSADVIMPMSDAAGCVRFDKALRQLNIDKPVTTSPLCADPAIVKAIGDLPTGWSFAFSANAFNDQDPEVALYQAKMAKYAAKGTPLGGYATPSFALILTTARFLNEIGPDAISADAIREQAKAFRGPLFLGPRDVRCGQIADRPSICTTETRVNTYQGDGKWETYDDRMFQPPNVPAK